MRRIKRTKITVIRTETVFLKTRDESAAQEFFQTDTAELTEKNITKNALEIEAIKQTENKQDNEGEIK